MISSYGEQLKMTFQVSETNCPIRKGIPIAKRGRVGIFFFYLATCDAVNLKMIIIVGYLGFILRYSEITAVRNVPYVKLVCPIRKANTKQIHFT